MGFQWLSASVVFVGVAAELAPLDFDLGLVL